MVPLLENVCIYRAERNNRRKAQNAVVNTATDTAVTSSDPGPNVAAQSDSASEVLWKVLGTVFERRAGGGGCVQCFRQCPW